jgi:hypothetical protein
MKRAHTPPAEPPPLSQERIREDLSQPIELRRHASEETGLLGRGIARGDAFEWVPQRRTAAAAFAITRRFEITDDLPQQAELPPHSEG